MIICPCKSCPNIGCGAHHDECQAYQDFLRELKAMRKREKSLNDTGRGAYVKETTARYRTNHVLSTHKR
jgi:hypothetical protein|nr:MAG TPA: transposase [Caudoviricetes sp.]